MIGEVVSPQELRARLARSYIAAYRRAGIQQTDQELEALALADCELVDAARRNGELGHGPTAPPTSMPTRLEGAPVPEPIARALEQTNTRLAPDATPDRIPMLHRNPQKVAEKWAYACARINRIIEACAHVKVTTIGEAAAASEYPKLAREWAELWSFWMTRGRAAPLTGVDHNPFRMLSDRDASRLFMRKVYDICDRSTGVLGSWWVK
jgi:hypothetical protein